MLEIFSQGREPEVEGDDSLVPIDILCLFPLAVEHYASFTLGNSPSPTFPHTTTHLPLPIEVIYSRPSSGQSQPYGAGLLTIQRMHQISTKFWAPIQEVRKAPPPCHTQTYHQVAENAH